MNTSNFNLFTEVKPYIDLSRDLQSQLAKNPSDWGKFQQSFNIILDKLYRDILIFEKENIKNSEALVYKLKKIFEKRYRKYFLYGQYIKWSYDKPYGYSGDFKIIDDIYKNNPTTVGFDRLWDNYFQQLAAPRSIRERKDDFKKIIYEFVSGNKNKTVDVMDLASGPAREIKELLEEDKDRLFSRAHFDCYDIDENSMAYAKSLINNPERVSFYQKNAIRLALKKNIEQEIPTTYDLIYSTGLFDYLDDRLAVRLLSNLKKLLKKNGIMVISNASEKYTNPSAGWMEWVADWYLIYRTQAGFKKIFVDAGFPVENVQVNPQRLKVMQYGYVRNL